VREAATALLVVLAPACAEPAVACREPDVSLWTVEGEEAASCDVTLDRCDDDSYTTVSCSNQTFEGTYRCGWMTFRGSQMASDSWDSEAFCRLDVDGMVAELDAVMPVALRIE
jgi:hypothetical protein